MTTNFNQIKRISFFLLLVASAFGVSAQVTVGNDEDPVSGSLLQIKETKGVADDAANSSKGLSLPRVHLSNMTNLYPMFLADPSNPTSGSNTDYTANKATLDKTHTGLTVYNTNNTAPFNQGVYTWKGTTWEMVGGVIPTEPWQVSGSSNEATSNTQNIYQMGRVSVGTTANVDTSAVLNIVATNKGVLLPRVTLKGQTDTITIHSPSRGLLVYNTGDDTSFAIEGYLYWNGSEWRLFDSASSTPPAIVQLLCGGATISPSAYYEGTPYTGVMKVAYTGGNGGAYDTGDPVTVNGLTFRLQAGKLEVGSGELLFNVSGTPTVTSPVGTHVPLYSATIPFFSDSCTAVVGDQLQADIKTIAVMDYMSFQTDPDTGAKGFGVKCTTPDGLYTVRVWLRHSNQTAAATASNNTESVASGSNNNVQLRNNTGSTKVIMWNYSTFYGGQITDAGGNLSVPASRYGGGAGNTWTNSSPTVSASWGNAGIYNANSSGPEYRYYSWIDTDPNTKVTYTVYVMSGMDPGATITDATKNKVYIKIEQVSAN